MENKLLINGGRKLFGEVRVDGSKNSFLPIMAGCLLAEDDFCLNNFTHIEDLKAMTEILEVLGCKINCDKASLYIDTKHSNNAKITHELTQKVRASIFLLGPLLAKFRSCVVAYPGGCNIGARPIDIHLKGLRSLGAKIIEKHGYIYCFGENLHSAEIVLDFPSVGATESLMLCATLIEGETILKNVAREPEIEDLQNFINTMGGDIRGAGCDQIVIRGVKKLHGCTYDVMSDRIIAGTYLLAGAMCGGDVLLDGAIAEHNECLLALLNQTACQIDVLGDKIRLRADKRLSSISEIKTMPYPFFPTDLQAQMMALQTVCEGASVIYETMFENRFGQVMELKKMGADIVVKGQTALIKGVKTLYGADVFATDLRAGASLVLAGLKAEGYTTVHNIEFIDRGYEKIEEKYSLLGADIKRI
ncbi:MAG: UDP-N-acetylglucosamine 1-carboxyvinyltransferase [Clostridiales bacterium]|nr:UDP-N-acetylglucosamine 1-carboxyvinyltransferase [Clostridiales bacterium]